jgi:hypothetical protein
MQGRHKSKAVFPLAKVSTIMPATATRNSHYLLALATLGRHNINRNNPICGVPPKVAKASTVK